MRHNYVIRRSSLAFAALLALALILGVTKSSAIGPANSYTTTVFSDGFESGSLVNWNGLLGNGAATVTTAAAHTGTYGLRMTNASGQFQVVVKALPNPLPDSSVTFWVRFGNGNGFQQVAQARDGASSAHMWDLAYDGRGHGIHFYPYPATGGAPDIFTGNNTAPLNTWVKIEVQYTATATGGARLYINDQTQPSWTVTGNYTRATNFQRLQLWNDGTVAADFDDVKVASPFVPPTVPGAPTNVAGTAGDRSAALTWTAPASDGGSPITGYRITPYIGSTAQPAVLTGSAATSYTVTGLTNGTAYTFRVAAINSVGTGPDSSASPPVTPGPGYSNVVFADGFESGTLAWNGTPGTGAVSVLAAAARAGSYGLRMTNASGQYSFAVKALPSALTDSATSLWVRPTTGSGVETIAQARDGSSAAHMWDLYYDWNRQGIVLDAWRNSGIDEFFTGNGSVLPGTWNKVTVQYTATTSGGATLFLNGATQAGWNAAGDYSHASGALQVLQLWNDATGTTDFDDVRVATPPPPGAQVPGAPTGVTGIPRDHAVALNWTPPASDGGSAVSAYRITPYIGGTAQTPITTDYPVTSYTVSGLTNGTAYTFAVAAINGVGTGANSAQSPPVTPAAATAPGAPTGLTGTAGDGQVALSWTAPSDGGSPITNYLVTPYVGGAAQAPISTGSTSTTYTVSGLTNGVSYTFSVAAVNAVGQGPSSSQTPPLTPRAALSQYTYTIFSDGFESGGLSNWNTSQGTGSSTVVAAAAHTGGYGLRIATLETQYAYDVKVLSGSVSDSVTTFWIRPGTGSRVVTVAQARDGSSSINMWLLMYDGTRHGFLFYPYNSAGASTEIFTGTNSAAASTWVQVGIQYTGAANGAARLYLNGVSQPAWGLTGNYSHTANLQIVQLWNEGLSNNDFDDVSVATVSPAGAVPPSAPQNVVASPLDGAAQVTWDAPASDGGSPINGYRVTSYVNGVAQTTLPTGSTATSFRFGGLTNGTTYTFTVAAQNAAGPGPDSSPSNAVTPIPAPPPGPPSGVNATAGNQSASLTWTAPASDGGSPITNYRVTPYINGVAQTPIATGSTQTSYTVSGLTNGTTYTFTVAASNSSGYGAESQPSNPVTPAPPAVPGAPTSVSGLPRDSGVALTWSAPSLDGGSSITNYRITPYVGGSARTPVTTPGAATGFTVTGLTNGTTYTFTVAAINAIGTGPDSAPSPPVTPAVPPANPIVLENRNQGTTSWQLDIDHKATNHEIEGYASATSVNRGGSINFMVSLSSNAQYTMDIYRMGWYPQGTNPDGTSCAPSCGGRLMQHVGPLNGVHQATCPQVTTQNDPNFGLTECSWTPSYTLNVPTTWTTGNYIVKLRRLDGQTLESYMTFVVRDDSSTAAIVYSMDVTTWQAYNFWGGSDNQNVGYDLYGRFNDVTGNSTGGRAYTVSFDRPYDGEPASDGAGAFFNWDFPMLRFLESKGYDITYVTSVDLESNPTLLNGHRVFMNTGHDEYYSDNMRNNLLNGISSGVDMALFSANNFYYRITWAPNASGTANRRIHCDKNALAGSTTFEWRLLTPQQPENQIGGVMLEGVANDRPYLVTNNSSWIYAGTGLANYTGNGTSGVVTSGAGQNALPGVIGYEFDSRASTTQNLSQWAGFEPAGTTTVGHSFVPAGDGNATNVWSDAVLWNHPSGAMIFSAGTIQWSWGVDDGYNDGYCGCFHNYTNAATQRITQNILDRFTGQ